MDESMVSFHTPETKNQSKQWLPRGAPGPLKARSQASRKKQMIFAFFDVSGSIYEHFAPIGTQVNSDYLTEVLQRFLKAFKCKRPSLAAGVWFLHWDNAPIHTSSGMKTFLDAKGIKTLCHPPYSPDLAPADFFLFPTVKTALSGLTISGNSVQTDWERAIRTLPTEDFRRCFERWLERHKKCLDLDGGYVEKSDQKKIL